MNLVIRARDVIAGISPKLVDEFDQLLARINFVWMRGHNAQTGEHQQLVFDPRNTPTQLSVGTAGPAAALPATPLGYLSMVVNGTTVVVPYFRP